MTHPTPAAQQRREAEFAAAQTRAEVDALQLKWLAEDEAVRLAESDHARELRDMRDALADARARIRRLEQQLLNKDGIGLSDHIVGVIGQTIGRVATDIRKEIPRFLGVFEPGQVYKRNSLVTRQGGLWHCTEETTTAPGSSNCWVLCVKSHGSKGVE